MMKEQIRKAIDRFWKGNLSREEQQKLLSDLEKEVDTPKMDKEFGQQAPKDADLFGDQQYTDILKNIHAGIGVDQAPKRNFVRLKWAAVAASLLLVAGSITALFITQNSSPESLDLALTDSLFLDNPTASTRTFQMVDGSIVKLAPHSKISYTQNYGKEDRQLHLEGEARFSVAHDSLRPFVVTAKGYSTTALGTEFVVNTQHIDHVSVKLIQGKVVVRTTPVGKITMEDQYLEPGDELRIDELNQLYTLQKPKPTPVQAIPSPTKLAYKPVEKTLVEPLKFDRSPLRNVFDKIAQIKNVQILTQFDNIDDMEFTGEFKPQESLEIILTIICQMNDLNYSIEGNKVLISKKSE